MNILVLNLYNSFLRLHIKIFRTPDRKFIYSKQLTPNRNLWKDTEFDSLDQIKGEVFGEIINGYIITQNLLGMDFIDDLMTPMLNINDGVEEEKKEISV